MGQCSRLSGQGNDAGESVPANLQQYPVAWSEFRTVRQVGPAITSIMYGSAGEIGNGFPGVLQPAGQDSFAFKNSHNSTTASVPSFLTYSAHSGLFEGWI